LPKQFVVFAAQCVAQVPVEQTSSPLQATAQPPQCLGSMFRSMHLPPQSFVPGPHFSAHVPSEQTSPAAHAAAQAPQFAGSI